LVRRIASSQIPISERLSESNLVPFDLQIGVTNGASMLVNKGQDVDHRRRFIDADLIQRRARIADGHVEKEPVALGSLCQNPIRRSG